MFWKLTLFVLITHAPSCRSVLYQEAYSYNGKYAYFSEDKRLDTLEEIKEMFYFGYDNYVKHAFPLDELDPIHCIGRGPDYENPSNININDVLGDYALTLVDTLDTLAVMGNGTEFKNAVQLVLDNVSFDKPSTVQVFEANIRIIGGLLAAHLIITDDEQPFGDMVVDNYDNELLFLAHDLAARLLPAFENTATGIPYPRVHLQEGVPVDCVNTTCLAGAGSLLLEFGLLSRLLQDPVYDSLARRTVDKLWMYRSNVTGLFGNVIDIQTGAWHGAMSGVGAGLDSFFEYLLKSFILFGDPEDLRKFNESYETIKFYQRKGRKQCNSGVGYHPIYVNVNMKNGDMLNNWVDSLQAAWAGVQVLQGDIEEAICSHAFHYAIWRRFGASPERYNWHLKASEVSFYPLRPELVESTYLLYRATKNPFYLHVGRHILDSINNHTRVKCGYATIHDVNKKDLEDRMESFFLSETCKYLYLLFDTENHLNKRDSDYIFTTEGHIIPLSSKWRRRPWLEEEQLSFYAEEKGRRRTANEKTSSRQSSSRTKAQQDVHSSSNSKTTTAPLVVTAEKQSANVTCDSFGEELRYNLPLKSTYLRQLEAYIGLGDSGFL